MYGILHCVVEWIVPNSGNILADSLKSPTKDEAFQNIFVILRAPLGNVCVCGRFKCIVAKLLYYYYDLLLSQNVCFM